MVPSAINSSSIALVGFVFMKASVSASTGVHCEKLACSWRVHSQPVGQQPSSAAQPPHFLQALGPIGGLAVRRAAEEHRAEQALTQAENTAEGVDGQRPMHWLREPPGQPEGVGEGGEGEGEGDGEGDGLEPEVVEPISPNLMFE